MPRLNNNKKMGKNSWNSWVSVKTVGTKVDQIVDMDKYNWILFYRANGRNKRTFSNVPVQNIVFVEWKLYDVKTPSISNKKKTKQLKYPVDRKWNIYIQDIHVLYYSNISGLFLNHSVIKFVTFSI